jgi:CelD/BcsL family acetyltransferase involved in cellulose biosynthesis
MKFCPEPLWESLVRADETATFFQTPAWHAIAARHFNAERAPLLFDFPIDQGGPACLPLLRDRRWGRWRYFSPFGTYIAVVCPRALKPDEIAFIEDALKSLNIHLVSSPFTRNVVRVGKAIPARTQVLDLVEADPDNVTRDWAPDPRRKLRMAREAGVTVRAAASAEDWDAYLAVYRKSLRRWGASTTSVYPESLFRDLRELPEASMSLWLAEHEGRVAAGYLAFYHNRHACVWHAASDPELFRLGAVQLTYHDIIADATRRRFPILDLLGSGGLSGVEAFKTSLGAKTRKFNSSLNRTGIVGALAGLRDRLRGR